MTLASTEETRSWLLARVSDILETDVDDIPPEATFTDLGLSSIQAVTLSGEIETHLGVSLDPSLLYDYPTVEALAEALTTELAPSSGLGPV